MALTYPSKAARDENGMLEDGSNPEGVDPVPPLNWEDKSALSNVVVHGPMFSTATTKIRCALVFAKIAYKHTTHMKDKPQGMKPGTPYQKIPVLDVAGRQVNDSAIIMKHLFPALGLEFVQEWENKIVLGLDTSVKIQATHTDWARLANKTLGTPQCLNFALGRYLRSLESKQGYNNIANSGCGHYNTDLAAFASEFNGARKGKRFVGGDKPGHPDISLYGFLAGFIAAKAPIAGKFIKGGGLEDWLVGMEQAIPLKDCFQKPGKEGYSGGDTE